MATIFSWRGVPAALLALMLAGCAQAPAGLGRAAFVTGGGEAWAFDKPVAITAAGDCPEIVVTTPRGTVTAAPRDGQAEIRVPLDAGVNRITAACRAAGGQAGAAAEQTWDLRLADRPQAEARLTVEDGRAVLDAGASRPAAGRPAVLVRQEWRPPPGDPPLPGLPAEGARVVLPALPEDGEHRVMLRVTDAAGRSDEAGVLLRVAGGAVQEVDPARGRPAWIDGAVVYGVVPRLFGPRGLPDVTARLGELADLGVTVLWLAPITAAPDDDFGYAVTDLFRLRDGIGTEADLERLVAEAHRLGLRVIMDFVPNHLSDRHAYWSDREARGEASPYRGFFEGGALDHYFDWSNLKNLEYDNPEVQAMMIAAFAHWVRRFDVDGFRVDAAWGPRRRAPEFWPRWRAELTRIKPDLLLLAEASARDPYWGRSGFAAAYDWTRELGKWAWQPAFEAPGQTAALLRRAIGESLAAAEPGHAPLVFRFLNNNDTGARFVTRHGVARTRVAAALLLTLPGLPGLYTGDEVGAAFEPYDEGPPIPWSDAAGLRPWYRGLIALRRTQPALRSPALRFVEVAPADRLLAYVRGEGPGSVLVLLNFGREPLRLPAGRLGILAAGATDLLDGRPLPRGPVQVPAEGVRLLALK